jgi:geranylgeranyl pyrophosphate synthase
LTAYLEVEQSQVDAALERALVRWSPLLPPGVAAAMAHGVRGGGKRLRPVLCVAAYRACGGDSSPSGASVAVYDLAASLELIHGYSLMHDDLPCMDDAALRRGLPATHRVHGDHATIVAGAAMIPVAALQAWQACGSLALDRAGARAVVRELLQASGGGGMVGGQVLDLLAEGRSLSSAELDELHGRKTGALLKGALRMGGMAAGASASVLTALDVFGQAVGLAFQIADDLLDATATVEALGKNPSDAALRKSTYVSVHGVEEARRRASSEVSRAREALAGVGLGGEHRETAPLHALADFAVSRGR